MKNRSYSILAVFAFALLIMGSGCRPDAFPPVGDYESPLSKLPGTWQLQQVVQVDNDAQSKGFPEFAVRQDITDAFAFRDLTILLKEDRSFEVTAGQSPNIFGAASGQWSADNELYPAELLLTDGQGTKRIEFGSFAHLDAGHMELKVIRKISGQAGPVTVVTYTYSFVRQ